MKKHKLLIIDSDSEALEFIEALLMDEHNITTANDSTESQRQLVKQKFDMLITSYDLPGKNGIELLNFAKGLYPSILVILMVSQNERSIAREAIQAGAFDLIEKPIQPNDCLRAIARYSDNINFRKVNSLYLELKASNEAIKHVAKGLKSTFTLLKQGVEHLRTNPGGTDSEKNDAEISHNFAQIDQCLTTIEKLCKDSEVNEPIHDHSRPMQSAGPLSTSISVGKRAENGAHIPKALFVDDEPELVELGIRNLEEMGFDAQGAFSGQAALNKISNEDFDLIMSDIRMENGDGLFLLEGVVKAYIGTPPPVFILITSFSDHTDAEIREKGATAQLYKPFDHDQLRAAIEPYFPELFRRS